MTTSASGVDPHISEANARIQANRVAAVRGLDRDRVLALIDDHASRPLFGLGGAEVRQRRRAQPRRSTGRHDVRTGILRPPCSTSLRKLDPRDMVRNPVMFVVEVGARRSRRSCGSSASAGQPGWFAFTVAVLLWLTVIFGNFAEAIAEGRGKAQAATLRAMRHGDHGHAARRDAPRPASELVRGDVVVVEAGEVIPGDGTVVEGIASVDESAITGESAPVIRESGGDRSAVTGGTRVLSDRIVVEITQEPGGSFLDRMIALVEGAARRKTPERDRALDPARRPDDRLPRGRRHAAAVRRLRRHRHLRSPS